MNADSEIKQPVQASTVILLQETDAKLQVYLLQRSLKSGFFPGFYVFPGGKVDPADRSSSLDQLSLDQPLQKTLVFFGQGLDPNELAAYMLCAARELFEETGILLFRLADKSRKKDFDLICGLRTSHTLSTNRLQETVLSKKWKLMASNMAPWSHWITPLLMPQRFDTRFFIALMPADQTCSPDDQETIQGIWLTPEEALSGNLEAKRPLSPPTIVTLQELLPYKNLAQFQKAWPAFSWGQPRLPKMMRLADTSLIIEPWDPDYAREFRIDEKALANALLPVGAPFSRLWFFKGAWRPVKAL